jgi:signal transduction histidine kinase
LLIALMLLIAAITGVVLFVAEHNTQASFQDALQQKFQSKIAFELGLAQGRQAAVEERCRLLARSVRIRAALQEDDVADLYDNAMVEMPDVFEDLAPGEKPAALRANFVRFLNPARVVLSPTETDAGGNLNPWENSLAAFGADSDQQQQGYVILPGTGPGRGLNEVICTPVIDADTGQKLGNMILGFTPAELGQQAGDGFQEGIVTAGSLFIPPGTGTAIRTQMARAINPMLANLGDQTGRFQVAVGGAPYLVFYRLLNPGSPMQRAYQVCLYPLADSLARQQLLRWQILGAGFVILLLGLAASHVISSRLARPVEKIAADSAANQAGRQQAEAALELTADELRVVNTELEKALENLQATQHQVIQQERLRALGEMASGIAHDFNNALMPISGFSELLMLDPDLDRSTTQQYLEMINTAARDAGSLVGRMREFYRPNKETDIFGAVNLSRLVKQAVNLTQPKWKDQAQANGAEVTVRVELEDKLPINGDDSALRELLTNLIFNAVDAMPQGGFLRVLTRNEPDCGVLEIIDTGSGMTEETRQRCLEPFYSTKGERGTGLGLAMVFGIIQRHQGSIDIASKVGEGTKFTIRLPLYQETTAEGEAAASIVSGHRLQVLVVDDEPQVRQVITAFLNAEGHICETANHAIDGLHRFRERHFDIVIADKAMPGMSGDQMAASMRTITPAIPFVLLTGFGSFLNGEEMAGVDVIASKPITRAGLREAIGKAFKAA